MKIIKKSLSAWSSRLTLLGGAALLVPTCAHASTILLTDSFNGNSLNSTTWETRLPFATSSVGVSNGSVTTKSRAVIATQMEMSALSAYAVSGSFTMLHAMECFTIALRTDLSVLPDLAKYNVLSGMFITISNSADQLHIEGRGFSPENSVAGVTFGNYPLAMGQTYSFSVIDTGTQIFFSLNGIDLLSATTEVRTGGRVAFHSREFGFTSSSIDSVTISSLDESEVAAARRRYSVSDEGASALGLALIGMLGLVGLRRVLS